MIQGGISSTELLPRYCLYGRFIRASECIIECYIDEKRIAKGG